MTNQYLRNSVADHITGAISACEGIRNNLVILNGPIGCKTYYTFSGVDSVVRRSDLWSLRGELQLEDAMDDHLLRSQYCVGSARTPATNLRYTDHVHFEIRVNGKTIDPALVINLNTQTLLHKRLVFTPTPKGKIQVEAV